MSGSVQEYLCKFIGLKSLIKEINSTKHKKIIESAVEKLVLNKDLYS